MSEAESYWRSWIAGEHSSARLRAHTKPLIEQLRLAAQRQDWHCYCCLFETYSYVAPYCTTEPLLTEYEGGIIRVHQHLADLLAVAGDYSATLHHVSLIKAALAIGDERRASLGMVHRGNSMLRFQCLGLQAICLLHDPDFFATEQPETEVAGIAGEFWQLAEHIEQYLQENMARRPEYVQITVHSMARSEIEICKLCWRYTRSLAEKAISNFNGRYGEHLETPACHFELTDEHALRSAWYWDFELSKLQSGGLLTKERLRRCTEGRRLGAQMWVGSGPEPLFMQLWTREKQELLEQCPD